MSICPPASSGRSIHVYSSFWRRGCKSPPPCPGASRDRNAPAERRWQGSKIVLTVYSNLRSRAGRLKARFKVPSRLISPRRRRAGSRTRPHVKRDFVAFGPRERFATNLQRRGSLLLYRSHMPPRSLLECDMPATCRLHLRQADSCSALASSPWRGRIGRLNSCLVVAARLLKLPARSARARWLAVADPARAPGSVGSRARTCDAAILSDSAGRRLRTRPSVMKTLGFASRHLC